MNANAYILSWTMHAYDQLLAKLTELGFMWQKEYDSEHVRVVVPFSRRNEFADTVQPYLSKPFNYVDVKYPEENKLLIIFAAKRYIITSKQENEAVRIWAIAQGLPKPQAEWSHWFV